MSSYLVCLKNLSRLDTGKYNLTSLANMAQVVRLGWLRRFVRFKNGCQPLPCLFIRTVDQLCVYRMVIKLRKLFTVTVEQYVTCSQFRQITVLIILREVTCMQYGGHQLAVCLQICNLRDRTRTWKMITFFSYYIFSISYSKYTYFITLF